MTIKVITNLLVSLHCKLFDFKTRRLIIDYFAGHAFKSLNTSGFVPKQGKLIADRVDGFW